MERDQEVRPATPARDTRDGVCECVRESVCRGVRGASEWVGGFGEARGQNPCNLLWENLGSSIQQGTPRMSSKSLHGREAAAPRGCWGEKKRQPELLVGRSGEGDRVTKEQIFCKKPAFLIVCCRRSLRLPHCLCQARTFQPQVLPSPLHLVASHSGHFQLMLLFFVLFSPSAMNPYIMGFCCSFNL